MGKEAFFHCKKLKEVVFPPKLQRISRRAFQNCTELESIVIPPSVQYVENYAFAGCERLKSVVAGGDTYFEEMTFQGCHNLEIISWKDDFVDLTQCPMLSSGENMTQEERESYLL